MTTKKRSQKFSHQYEIESYEITREMLDIAKRRTRFVIGLMTYYEFPISILLANAYMQGMNDAFDVAAQPKERKP
jgi:hypothetical protein